MRDDSAEEIGMRLQQSGEHVPFTIPHKKSEQERDILGIYKNRQCDHRGKNQKYGSVVFTLTLWFKLAFYCESHFGRVLWFGQGVGSQGLIAPVTTLSRLHLTNCWEQLRGVEVSHSEQVAGIAFPRGMVGHWEVPLSPTPDFSRVRPQFARTRLSPQREKFFNSWKNCSDI